MSNESRSDSLAVRLTRLELLDEYFTWFFSQRPSFADRLEWLEKHDCTASAGSLHRLHNSPEARTYRAAFAAQARAQLDASLPDMSATIRESLLNQRYNAVLGELSHGELMDHLAVQRAEAELKLKAENTKLKKQDLSLKERRIALLEQNAASAKEKLEKVKELGGLSAEVLAEIEGAAKLL